MHNVIDTNIILQQYSLYEVKYSFSGLSYSHTSNTSLKMTSCILSFKYPINTSDSIVLNMKVKSSIYTMLAFRFTPTSCILRTSNKLTKYIHSKVNTLSIFNHLMKHSSNYATLHVFLIMCWKLLTIYLSTHIQYHVNYVYISIIVI